MLVSSPQEQTVYLVEDDDDIRLSFQVHLQNSGFKVVGFASAEEFLAVGPLQRPCCAVIDICLGGKLTGIALYEELKRRTTEVPTIFISGFADVSTAVSCMRTGALMLLEKPVAVDGLLKHVREAIERDQFNRLINRHVRSLQASLQQLTTRERGVLDALLAGKLNKQIAQDLDVSERTIEVDRSRILKKFNANNAAELAVKATELRMLSGFTYRLDPAESASPLEAASLLHLSNSN
jgi:FixJ family two-component response regulator